MSLSILSNLTKSPDAPKASALREQETPQDAVFANFFGETAQPRFKSAALLPSADTREGGIPEPADTAEGADSEGTASLIPGNEALRETKGRLHFAPLTQNGTSSALVPTAIDVDDDMCIGASRAAVAGEGNPARTAARVEGLTGPENATPRQPDPVSTTITGVDQGKTVAATVSETARRAQPGPETGNTEINQAIAAKITVNASQHAEAKAPISSMQPHLVDDVPSHGLNKSESGMRDGIGQMDSGTDDMAFPVVRRDQSTQMSMLERHLGGHPATLLPSTGSVRNPGPRSTEVIRFNHDGTRVRDAPLTSTTAMHAVVTNAPQINATSLAQNVKATAVGIATQDLLKGGIGADPLGSETAHELGWDIRAPSAVSGTASTANLPKPDVGGAVIQQIADAMRRSPDRPVEIALNPVELGRVRMVLSASDAGISVSILADRPDTLELLRRNIDDLGKSFAEMGYEDISFSFGQGDQTDQKSEPQKPDLNILESGALPPSDQISPPSRHTPSLAIAPDAIDMRL